MGKRRGPWDDGHRAWTRLTAWQSSRQGGTDQSAGDDALDAMADIGILRRLLEQSELAAVRTARRHRKSWAEIATQLGITRQSAWERWRELDDDAEPLPESIETPQSTGIEIRSAPLRQRGKIVVPNVVGLTFAEARDVLLDAKLAGVMADEDGTPLSSHGWSAAIVVDQVPEAGAKVPALTRVQLWVEQSGGGGSAGVREPRRPSPTPKSGYEWRDEYTEHDEQTEEAVG